MIKLDTKSKLIFTFQVLCYVGALLIMAPLLQDFANRLMLGLFFLFLFHQLVVRLDWNYVLVDSGQVFRIGDQVYSLRGHTPFSGTVVDFEPKESRYHLVLQNDGEKIVVDPRRARKAIV